MKKFLFLVLSLSLFHSMNASDHRTRLAITTQMDTVFTLLSSISTRNLEINLSSKIEDQIRERLDTNTFTLQSVHLPKGAPSKRSMNRWLKELNKKGFDLFILLYKPNIDDHKHQFMNGLSYGYSLTSRKAFSINDAIVYDVKTGEALSQVLLYGSEQYVRPLNAFDRIPEGKRLGDYSKRELLPAVEAILELNASFSDRAVMKIWEARTLQHRSKEPEKK